jgi:hypothetical protein
MNTKGITVKGIKDLLAGWLLRMIVLLLAVGIGSAAFASTPAVHEWEAKAPAQQTATVQPQPIITISTNTISTTR